MGKMTAILVMACISYAFFGKRGVLDTALIVLFSAPCVCWIFLAGKKRLKDFRSSKRQ